MEEITNAQSTDQEQAGLGDRLLGILIDEAVVIVISFFVGNALGWKLSYLLAAAYMMVRDALPFLDGQSIGKKVMKTRAVYEDSSAPLTNDYRASILRNILLIVPLIGLIDALFIFGGDKKRLGDKIGKTIVIYDRTRD